MNKLISNLGARTNVLVTDLMEFEPAAGAPSEKGTVTQIFTDASGNLAINRDSRLMLSSDGKESVNWESRQLKFDINPADVAVDWFNEVLYSNGSTKPSVDWFNHLLIDESSNNSLDWENRQAFDAGATKAADWGERQLFSADGSEVVLDWADRLLNRNDGSLRFDWEAGQFYYNDGTTRAMEIENTLLIDPDGFQSVNWYGRTLKNAAGTTILDWNTQQPSSGAQTAGAIYTATEQTMLQEAYDALRAYGLLS